MLHLVEATDDHWAWLSGERPNAGDWLLPEGGVDDLPTMCNLRRVTHDLRSAECPHSYLIVHGNEVVGLCGYKHPPRPDGRVEIGFGIAAARRNRGYATRAVALLLEQASRDQAVCTVLAETHIDNIGSQCVLRRNGFTVRGKRHDDEEGDLLIWSAPMARPEWALT
jgi:RimJ/RimL family protein N-acetyltransferase